jgi:hypothetical protein
MDMVGIVQCDDDDDDDAEVHTGAADKSAMVDEAAAIAALEAIGSGSRRTPPELMWKWMLPNIMSIPSRRPEKAERDASA